MGNIPGLYTIPGRIAPIPFTNENQVPAGARIIQPVRNRETGATMGSGMDAGAKSGVSTTDVATTKEIKTAPVGVMGAYTGALQPVGTLKGGVVSTPIPAINKQITEEAGKAYDEQVAKLPSGTTPTETKPEFIKRSIQDAIVTITTTTSKPKITNRTEVEAEFLSKGESSIGWNNTAQAIKNAGLTLPKGKKGVLGEKALTKDDMRVWYNGLSESNKVKVLSNFVPYSAIANLKQVGTQLSSMIPVYGTIKYWNKMKGWQKALSIGTDILVVAPIASGGLKLAGVKPIGDFVPRIGLLQVAEARIGEMTVKISKPVILSSANDVAKFEKVKEAVSKEWAWLQHSKMTPKEGEALLPDAVLKQLEGLPYSEKTIIEYPYKFIVSHGQFSTPWGQAIKRPGVSTFYTKPIDEALVEIPEISKASKFGEGGYGKEGQWTKAQFEAETKRVKLANLLEDKPWELTPEVKRAIQKERQTRIATAEKEATATKEKFKTITEKKTVSEHSTKTASETERLESIRREYSKPKKVFTSPYLVDAVSTMTIKAVSSAIGVSHTAAPDIIKRTTKTVTDIGTKVATQITPDIQTIIKDADTGNTAVDRITQQAIQQALQNISKADTANMTDTQIRNAIEQQVRNSIKNQIEQETKTTTRQALQTKLATMTERATKTTTRIVDKIRDTTGKLLIKFPVIIGHDGKQLTKEQVAASVGWKQGFMYRLKYPPYGESNTIYSTKPIPGIPYHEGAGSAYASLVQITKGKLPPTIKDEMGAFTVTITAKSIGLGRKAMEFERMSVNKHRHNVRVVKPHKHSRMAISSRLR